MPEQTPITGKENSDSLAGPMAALVEFYNAFNWRDIVKMEQNWAATDEVAMSNPLGGIKRGWPEIKGVYERIFSERAQVYVEFYDYTISESGEMFIAIGRERGEFRLGGTVIQLAIRTSRLYRLTDGRWRQLHHHGSIEDADLLKRYQDTVAGK